MLNTLPLIKQLHIPQLATDFKTSAGVYKDTSGPMLIIEVVDTSHGHKKYTQSISCKACNSSNIGWMAFILSSNMISIINECRSYTRKSVKEAFTHFIKILDD